MSEQVKPSGYQAPAFEEAWRLHRKRVFSLCMKMVRDPGLAEDLTQEVFLQLHRKLHLFRGDSLFSTWLHRLAFNVVLMHLRKNQIPTLSLDSMQEDRDMDGHDGYDRAVTYEDGELRSVIDRTVLIRALNELPAGYRMILVLHDIEGMEHNEIAETLGCSIGNSKSQVHKARLRLAALLGAYGVAREQKDKDAKRETEAKRELSAAFAALEKYM